MIWESLPLSGTVTTFTYVSAPPAGFDKQYILASVRIDKLDKAILGRFHGEKLEIGDRVQLTFEKIGDQSLFIFQSVTG
ncbi:MAG: OB-fold domain-containing protein [Candidatus Kariarchaeaceae archaeon]